MTRRSRRRRDGAYPCDVGEIDVQGVTSTGGRAAAAESLDRTVVGREQALTGSVNRALRSQAPSVDVGSTAESANVGAERAA